MIISSSRRTDIPAYYSRWFIQRVREGFAEVRNPMFPEQLTRVSLHPGDVDCIVFWTRNPGPLLKYLPELDDRGFSYYFLITLLDYPALLEPRSESLDERLRSFKTLADKIGPGKTVWRYDPVIVTKPEGFKFHAETFGRLSAEIHGYTDTVIISFYDSYRKSDTGLADKNILPFDLRKEKYSKQVMSLLQGFKSLTDRYSIDIQSCGESFDTETAGIPRRGCIDGERIFREFGIKAPPGKDRAQREICLCAKSRDIGRYDTCIRGCLYCYATKSGDTGPGNYRKHDPGLPRL